MIYYCTSVYAVSIYLWIALDVHILTGFIKKRTNTHKYLHAFLRILSVIIFEKAHILQVLSDTDDDFFVTERIQLILSTNVQHCWCGITNARVREIFRDSFLRSF